MAPASTNAITPLTSQSFTTGRWSGGRATVQDAYFQYRTVNTQAGKSFTVVELHVVTEDEQGQKHDVPYQANFKDPVVIRADADDDADEAERGYAISGGGIRADQDAASLLQALWANGFPESKMSDGDVRGLIGIDAEWVEKPHKGVKEDKYPMLLPTEIYGGVKGGSKAGAKASAKSRKDADEDEEETPKAKKGSAKEEKSASASAGTPEKRARKYVLAAAKENDGETTAGDVVRSASKDLKGDDDKKAILDLLGDDDWLAEQDGWTYKRKTGEITLD